MRVTLRRLKWPELLRVQAWAALWTAFLILALSPVVHSATSTWNGGNTTSGNWTSTDNWVGGSIPSSTNSLVFSGTSNTLTNDNLASLFSVVGVTFAAGASPFALSGNSITLTGSIVNISTVLQTINLNIVQNSTQTYSTGVATTGGPGLIGLGDLMINGVISGTGGITKDSSVLWPAWTTK